MPRHLEVLAHPASLNWTCGWNHSHPYTSYLPLRWKWPSLLPMVPMQSALLHLNLRCLLSPWHPEHQLPRQTTALTQKTVLLIFSVFSELITPSWSGRSTGCDVLWMLMQIVCMYVYHNILYLMLYFSLFAFLPFPNSVSISFYHWFCKHSSEMLFSHYIYIYISCVSRVVVHVHVLWLEFQLLWSGPSIGFKGRAYAHARTNIQRARRVGWCRANRAAQRI